MSDDKLTSWERLHAEAVRQRVTDLPLFDLKEGHSKSLEEVDRELNEMTYASLGLSEQERWLIEGSSPGADRVGRRQTWHRGGQPAPGPRAGRVRKCVMRRTRRIP